MIEGLEKAKELIKKEIDPLSELLKLGIDIVSNGYQMAALLKVLLDIDKELGKESNQLIQAKEGGAHPEANVTCSDCGQDQLTYYYECCSCGDFTCGDCVLIAEDNNGEDDYYCPSCVDYS